MKKILALLVASTALTATIGVPAWSAMQAPGDGVRGQISALMERAGDSLPIVLASEDDDDDHDGYRASGRYGHDDDDDDDCDDDHDDDDCRGSAANPAPAGTVAPPQNGLFGSGAAPQVRTN